MEIDYKELHTKLDIIMAVGIEEADLMPSKTTVLQLMEWLHSKAYPNN